MAKKVQETKKNISFKVDEKLHKKFKAYCEKNNTTMKDELIEYMTKKSKPDKKKKTTKTKTKTKPNTIDLNL